MQNLFIVPAITKEILMERLNDPKQAYVMIDPTNRAEAQHLAEWQLAALQGSALKGEKPVKSFKEITPESAMLWTEGLIEELVKDNKFHRIHRCIKKVPGIVDHAENAINDFKKQDIAGILDGIKEIGQIFDVIPDDVAECEEMKPELERIKAWAAILKDPLKLAITVAGNVKKNYVEIFADLSEGLQDINEGKDKQAGKLAADILVDALGPVPKKPKQHKKKHGRKAVVNQLDKVDIDSLADQKLSNEEIMAALQANKKKNKKNKGKKVKAIMLI